MGREGRNDRQTHIYKTWGQVGYAYADGGHQLLQTKWNACMFIVCFKGAWLGSLGKWSPIGRQSQTVNIPEEEDAVASVCTH